MTRTDGLRIDPDGDIHIVALREGHTEPIAAVHRHVGSARILALRLRANLDMWCGHPATTTPDPPNHTAQLLAHRFHRHAAGIHGSVLLTRREPIRPIDGLSGFQQLFLAREIARARGIIDPLVEAVMTQLHHAARTQGLL